MNELIQVSKSQVGGDLVQTVNARELHEFLEVGKDFSSWIKGRIDQYDFREGSDFVAFDAAPQNGGVGNRGFRVEYHLSLDMAKELSMVERNAKGKQARQYFIDCEREAKSKVSALPNFSDPVAAARAWADAKESEAKALVQLEQAKPAIAFVESYVSSEGNKGFREVCKMLKANEREFREFLVSNKILYRLGGVMTPYAAHLDAGRFEVKAGVSEETQHAFNQAKFTPKGVEWVSRLWREYRIDEAA